MGDWQITLMVFLAYFVPVLVAWSRGHHQIGPIAVINTFLGWTFIGWVVALAMACSAVRPREVPQPPR